MKKQEITEKMLEQLRGYAREHLGDRRFAHTEAVEGEVAALARFYCPDKSMMLRAAALLHDITKEFKTEKQLKFCEKYGILVDNVMLHSPKCFHALTAAAKAQELFPAADAELISAVRYHTTGRAGMTLSDKLLYLADYIEPTRTFPDCVSLRRYFYENLERSPDLGDLLDDTLLYSFDLTIEDLIRNKNLIMPDTIAARNELCAAVSDRKQNGE